MTVLKNGKGNDDYPTDEDSLHAWYQYAAQQPGSVGWLLSILRLRQGQTEEHQREEIEVSRRDFEKLQSIPLPRVDRFQSDARRIATACQVKQVFRFVQMLTLARNLAMAPSESDNRFVYEAAFDAPISENDETLKE
ncbi:hypothetical protein [Dictyobacter arantiisoli]|uniref:Uncharacterized protein n=1 Tax=Dictyobacter arantiisoli TaxID=2014874 RepID=A0A5A5TJZ1_9CHLR|nr:hypothetical protein [Dictyobacter arantiisoli]GCF11396.1 hypothetical protein KDI_49600 [Dictyobacter arantiisoli]